MAVLKIPFSFEQCSFILFRTSLPNYSIAAQLNASLGINLKRVVTKESSDGDTHVCPMFLDDDEEDQLYSLPLFFFDSSIGRMQYYLIDISQYDNDMPPLKALGYYNYVLVMCNGLCYEKMMEIYDAIQNCNPPADPYDILAKAIFDRWRTFANSVEDCNYFDFRNDSTPLSSQWGRVEQPYKLSFTRTVNAIRKALVALFESVQVRMSL